MVAASKAFAEKAAWDFLEEEKPKFSLSTILPTLVFELIISLLLKYRPGEIFTKQVPGIHFLGSLNTSNQLIQAITMGAVKERIPDLG